MSLALEIRQCANDCAGDRPDIAHMAQAERLANPPPRPVFKLRIVP